MCDKSNTDNFVTVSSESSDNNGNIVRRGCRPKNSVQKYFEKRNSDTVQCTVCLKELKVRQGNTTSLMRHSKSPT